MSFIYAMRAAEFKLKKADGFYERDETQRLNDDVAY
jgi:hypothetical protein